MELTKRLKEQKSNNKLNKRQNDELQEIGSYRCGRSNHEEDIYVGYRYFDTFKKNVAYPFGYGLSYTTFEFGKPSVMAKGNNIEVSVTIKNTGKVAGKEVAEVYVTAPKVQLNYLRKK